MIHEYNCKRCGERDWHYVGDCIGEHPEHCEDCERGRDSQAACRKWLDTLTDGQLDNYSQVGLASEAWTRGAAYAAQSILNRVASRRTLDAVVGATRIEADRFFRQLERPLSEGDK